MIDRRDLLKTGIAIPVALGVPTALKAASQGVDLWVHDARYAQTPLAAALSRTAVLADGDVTGLWTGTLDDKWRARGFVIAGTTGSDALFVLEQLAWGRGRRVVERTEVAPAGNGHPALVRWVIAPVHPSVTA